MTRPALLLLAGFLLLVLAGCGKTDPSEKSPALKDPPADHHDSSSKPQTSHARFVDQAEAFGIQFIYRNSEEQYAYSMLETLGGGAGVLDYDLNGLPDILLPGGGRFEESRLPGLPSALYRNLGSGKFEEVAGTAQIRPSQTYSHGAIIGDYNADGFPDVVITGFDGVQLFTNQGDGTFLKEPTIDIGLTDTGWSASAGWGDITGDGFSDLYVTRYVNWSLENNPHCPGPGPHKRQVCKPTDFEGLTDSIYRNNGDGTFTDISKDCGLIEQGKGLGVLIADLDNDADLDVYVTNDTVANFCYRNLGGGKLEEMGGISGTAFNDMGRPDGSMGVALGDYNHDGLPDLWVTNYVRETFALYQNSGGMDFLHVSNLTGLTAVGVDYVGWGTTFLDFDHDADEDLFAVNGHVYLIPDNAPLRQRPLVYENLDRKRFRNIANLAGDYTAGSHRARGLARGDFDRDGREDLVISHTNEPAAVLMNQTDTAGNHWIGVRLHGVESDRMGIGAAVSLIKEDDLQIRILYGGGSYASTHEPAAVFGLGPDNSPITLKIQWPTGKTQTVENLEVDRYHAIVEGD